MTNQIELEHVRDVLRPLALREGDFAADDAVVERVAALKVTIDALDTSGEPWLSEWLTDERYKGAVLYAAGKTNWNHDQQGKGTVADRRMRAQIISRFNLWVDQLSSRIDHYECGSRGAASVAGWRTELALFRHDPVRND